jgi:uncharacterized membrane protein
MELWRLLAHNHWYTLNLLGVELRLCARCSGYLIGLTSFTLLTGFLGLNTGLWSQFSMIFAIVALSLPLIGDWVTQSWGLRDSTNFIRFVTGTLMGLGIGVFSQMSISLQTKRMIFMWIAMAVLLAGLRGIKSK